MPEVKRMLTPYDEGRIARIKGISPIANPYRFSHAKRDLWQLGWDQWPYETGDRIVKTSGDYTFEGNIVSIFVKRDDETIRIVAEDDRGLCFIFNPSQIGKV